MGEPKKTEDLKSDVVKKSDTKKEALEPNPKPEFEERFKDLVEEVKPYTESRVRLKEFKFPGGDERGGLPRNAKGSDGQPLLVEVPSTKKRKQYLHRLAAVRLEAMNKKWLADMQKKQQDSGKTVVPKVEPLALCSGWRARKFKSHQEFHSFCARIVETRNGISKDAEGQPFGRWLPPTYGSGPASKGNLPNATEKCSKWQAYDSPHQTGLAMDFGNNGLTASSTRGGMKDTPLFKWLKANAHLFGVTPLLHEAWHWEVKIPYDAWISGEEFVPEEEIALSADGKILPPDSPGTYRGQNFAVRVKGSGRTGDEAAVGAPTNKGKCDKKTTIGSEKNEKVPDLTQFKVQEPQVKIAKRGTQFPLERLRKRDLQSITNIVIHETAGGFGQVKAPPGVDRDPRCISTLVMKKLSIHYTIDQYGNVKQHAPLERIAAHAGKLNPISIAVELVNRVVLNTDTAKQLINGKRGKPPAKYMEKIGIIKTPFRSGQPYFIFNSQACVTSLWKLINQIADYLSTKGASGFHIRFPCTEGTYNDAGDPRWQDQGIIAHKRQKPSHSDGCFAEWFCSYVERGKPIGVAYQTAMGVFAEKAANRNAPWKAPTEKLDDAYYKNLAQAAIKEVRDKLKVETPAEKEEKKAAEQQNKEDLEL